MVRNRYRAVAAGTTSRTIVLYTDMPGGRPYPGDRYCGRSVLQARWFGA